MFDLYEKYILLVWIMLIATCWLIS
jgi:hypothetical protein